MNKQKHTWTDNDEIVCCSEYLKYSLRSIELKDYNIILEKLYKLLPEIKKSSLKMKLQNIKYLCILNNIPDFTRLKPLSNASIKNQNVFKLLIDSPDIKKLILLRKEDLTKYET